MTAVVRNLLRTLVHLNTGYTDSMAAAANIKTMQSTDESNVETNYRKNVRKGSEIPGRRRESDQREGSIQ